MALGDIVWFGDMQQATLLEDVPASFVIDKNGLNTATLAYQCKWRFAPLLAKTLKYHPDFYWLRVKKVSVTREEAYMARVQVEYEGVDPDQQVSTGAPTGENEFFALELSTDSEPIETHPRFDEFAGPWNSQTLWNNGASFDPVTGKFLGFKPTLDSGDPNPKGGIKSYLSPGVIYSRTRLIAGVSVNAVGVSLTKLGKIANPPSSSLLPQIPSGRNWLFLGTTIEEVGDGVRVVERWRLSGPRGWDTDIYTAE